MTTKKESGMGLSGLGGGRHMKKPAARSAIPHVNGAASLT